MSAERWGAAVAAVAALLGAAGVALAAAASHGGGHPSLSTAAIFLILHGGVGIALVAVSRTALSPFAYLASATVMVAGVALFAGDLAHRAFLNDRLFPFAAPTGGALMIGGWLLAAAAGLVGAFGRRV